MAYLSRAACAALLAGVGVMATTDAGLARAAPTITLASSGGGVYEYDIDAPAGAFFSLDQTITLSGLSGVTGASVSDSLTDFSVSSINSTSVTFEQTGAANGVAFGSGNWGTLVVDSPVLTTGTVDYSMMVVGAPNGISGMVEGPVGAAVPEPATWAMALLGFAGLSFAARRRAKSKGPAGFSAA
jgi:hypothetical protein